MASAKDGYPHVVGLFPEVAAQRPEEQPARDAALRALYDKLDESLIARVVEVNRLTQTIVEVDALRAQQWRVGQVVCLRPEQYRLFPSGA